MTNTQTPSVPEILSGLARAIWKKMKYEGDPPEGPTLSDIQNFTQDVTESDFIRVVGIDAHFWVTLSEEGFNASDPPAHVSNLRKSLSDAISRDYAREARNLYIHFSDRTHSERNRQRRDAWRALMQKLKQELKDVEETESQKISSATLYTLAQNREENENATLWLEATANEAQAITNFILQTEGEPTLERAATLHNQWKQWKESEENLQHPLAPIIRAWIQETTATPVTTQNDRKYPFAVLKHPLGSVRELAFTEKDVGQVFKTPVRVDQLQIQMDLGNEASILPAIMPLQVVRTAELKPQTKSGAVSHELRIFFEAMMALEPNQRRADLMFRLGDLIDFLYPNGKFNWTNQMPHIKRALGVLHIYATVPWIDDQGSLREWRPVAVRAPLIEEATRDTPIYMEVQMPPDARQGHMVIKDTHRKIGMKSAAQWNAYHVAAYLWDKYGTVKGKLVDPTRPVERRDDQNRLVDATGKPLVNRNGKLIKSPYHSEAVAQLDREPNTEAIQRYPILTDEDLIRACFPNGYPENNRRKYLQRAKAHWQRLEDDGIVVIHKEQNGWRILPSPEHLNAHRAFQNASKGVY